MPVRCAIDPMPAIPPGLTEWLPPGFFAALLGLIWYEVKAGEARVNKRIDDLRDDMKDGLNKLEARQREDNKALREDNKALNEKLDRLLEGRFSKLS